MVIAQKLRQIAGELRRDPNMNVVADVADRGAAAVDRVEQYVNEQDLSAIAARAQRFTRERPWVAASIGVASGIVASRVLKALGRRGKH